MGIVIPYKAINIKLLYPIYPALSRGFLHFSPLFCPFDITDCNILLDLYNFTLEISGFLCYNKRITTILNR